MNTQNMDSFYSLNLPKSLSDLLEKHKFSTPTPIQAQAIPVALRGKDIIGSAQTGTGKTLAFGIPLIERLLSAPDARALVVTPTRELATQVIKTLRSLLSRKLSSQTVLLIGGEPIARQLYALRKGVRLIVGTPGRINDHLSRGSLTLSDCTFLVLDETDRMLDMGFSMQIDQIVKHLPQERQTLLFSATMPENIVKIANRYLREPVRIEIGQMSAPAKNIKQDVLYVSREEKYESLVKQIEQREGSIIVFVKTKIGADKIAYRLRKNNHYAGALHGNLKHAKRERVIKAFRNRKYRIMVATDIAARGLDIPHIEHVINYDLPQCAEDYIHRIGRTARAGASGEALCFISPSDRGKWREITYLMDPNAASRNSNRTQTTAGRGVRNNKRRKNFREHTNRYRQRKSGSNTPRVSSIL